MNGTHPDELLRIAGTVEQGSNHPLALAVVRAAQDKNLDLPAASGLENLTGRGVKSEINGRLVLIGSLKLFRETDGHALDKDIIKIASSLENEGKTTMAVSYDEQFLGVLALPDAPRPGVKDTLQALLDLGIQKLVMLTGDNDDVAQRIGQKVGATDVRADLLPEQKLEAIRQLQNDYGNIAMTGDGVNDAPVLATATVEIAMGGAWRIGIDDENPTELITRGVFQISRNSIFLGVRLNLLGLFLVLPNAATLAIWLLGDVMLQVQVYLEEDYLRKVHGDIYAQYCQQVRRWL